MTKAESTAVGCLLVVGVIVIGMVKFFENVGYVVPLAVVAVVAIVYVLSRIVNARARLSYLRNKYADEELAQNIFGGRFWQGQTAEQLTDSLGEPVEVDRKVLKTKKKETWKYAHQGGKRFGLRITLENDIVVGWDEKA